ncbi:MAG: flagellar biosynthetic protein FliR [Phycisphaerales bacterium]
MIVYDALLPHLPALLLVITRIGGLFLFTPILSSPIIPRQVKALTLVMFAVAIYPTIPLHANVPVDFDLMTLAPMLAGELLIGAVIGLAAFIPLASLQLGGLFMGQQMGLAIANVLNPAIELEGNSIGQLLFYLGVAGYVAVGGLDMLFAAIVQTFAAVRLGDYGLTEAPLELLVTLIASGFELAIRVSFPVVTIIFLESIAVGFIMKTVPALNIMSFGFPLRIIVGIGLLTLSIVMIAEVIAGEMDFSMSLVQQWIDALANRGGG